ncbi:MAG: sensor histidine kinase [Ktedonobacteraceae bacterium]|nr:sensor histidine kinase [Ktedonobacteraceae bacterium]
MKKVTHTFMALFQRWHLSLFEKVILVNTLMLIGEALAGLWVTSHNLESHHYLIDTSFIILATLLTLFTNIFLLRISFRPLFGLLSTIRAISAGSTSARASLSSSDTEIDELAQSFNTMLDRLEEVRREQTALILQAQEDERRRIALELHDETGQSLTALLVHAELLHQKLQVLPGTALTDDTRKYIEEGLQQLVKLTQGTLENIRVLAQQLRPSVLDDLGLLAAFRWLVADSAERLHITVDLHIEGMKGGIRNLSPDYETALFRIAQESLTNIARHAQTHDATLTLREDAAHIYLQVQDQGCGYNPQQHHKGMGLFGMRERATLLGGTLTLDAHPGQGTTVQAVLPLSRKQGGAVEELPASQTTAEETYYGY